MAHAEAAYGQPTGATVSRAQAIAVVADAFRVVGLTISQRDFLLELLRATWPADWTAGRPFAAVSNLDLAEALQIGRSQIKNLTRQLAEAGFLVCRDGANGRRYRPRHIEDPGSGFDLTPILHRFGELQQAANARADAMRETRALRAQVFARKAAILGVLDTLRTAGSTGPEDLALAGDVAQLAALGTREREIPDLRARLDRLGAIDGALRLRLLTPPEAVDIGPQGPPESAPITTTTNLEPVLVEAEGRDAAQPKLRRSAPWQEEKERESGGDPLGGFNTATPAFVRRLAPELARLLPPGRSSPAEIVEAASYLAGELGISPHAWGQACGVLGRYPAAVAVAVIAAKSRAGLIARPGGYIRALCDRHVAGTLRLDATLFGLADGLQPVPAATH